MTCTPATSTSIADGKIVFFDFGIMGRVDPRTRWLLRELVYALLVKKDHAAAGKIVVLMGAVGKVKPEGQAAKDLEAFATPLTMKSLGDLSYAEIGKQLSTLADAYDVKLPRELVLIGKQFLYVERYMKLLAPDWQMMSAPSLPATSPTSWSRSAASTPRKSKRERASATANRHGPLGRRRHPLRGHGRSRRPRGAADHGAGRAIVVVAQGILREARRPGLAGDPLRQPRRRAVHASCTAVVRTGGWPPGWCGRSSALRSPSIYTLEDMADDAAALLDHLGIDRAHVVGASMGGMIAQVFAARFKHRTNTLAVIFSSNNQPLLPPPGPAQLQAILAEAEGVVARGDHRERDQGQQDHRKPGLSEARRDRSRRGDRGLRAVLLSRGHRQAFRRGPGHRQPAGL